MILVVLIGIKKKFYSYSEDYAVLFYIFYFILFYIWLFNLYSIKITKLVCTTHTPDWAQVQDNKVTN